MAVSVMFSMSGVNKQRFIERSKADPNLADWSGNGVDYETREEDTAVPPFLRSRSRRPRGGIIRILAHDRRTWGA